MQIFKRFLSRLTSKDCSFLLSVLENIYLKMMPLMSRNLHLLMINRLCRIYWWWDSEKTEANVHLRPQTTIPKLQWTGYLTGMMIWAWMHQSKIKNLLLPLPPHKLKYHLRKSAWLQQWGFQKLRLNQRYLNALKIFRELLIICSTILKIRALICRNRLLKNPQLRRIREVLNLEFRLQSFI